MKNAVKRLLLKGLLLGAALSTTLIGCTTPAPGLYYWGQYESLLHDMYIKPGSADAGTQVSKLTADIQEAESSGKKIAPGIYAHLGFMYVLQGRIDLAQNAFASEVELYPESKQFIEGLINRANDQRSISRASNQ